MSSELSFFGEHLIAGLAGPVLLPAEQRLLKELKPLGIILFAKNFERENSEGWRLTLADLLDRTYELTEREELIVSIDHEGGRVHRFPAPVTRFPAAKNWTGRARDVAFAMGSELAALGFNLSYAPVLDVHSEPANPVIGERALSSSPEETARYAVEFLRGLESAGMLGCGKHFPGHGATTQDSHLVLPRLEAAGDILRKRELLPFAALIAEEIPLLMTAHVVYPSLDPDSPATLSARIATTLLREELGYRRALITDDLEMKALAALSPEAKALGALTAGNDILLEANPAEGTALEIAEKMLRATAKQCDKGRLDLAASKMRISALLETKRRLASAWKSASERGDLVGSAEHASLAQSLQTKAV